MLRTSLIALLAALSFAQTAVPPPPASPQPPAEVDRALRARIQAFYDLLVDRQYRKAEEFVAPDYRDFYYNRDKPSYLSYELTSLAYSENFTHADVVVMVKMPSINPMIPGALSLPAPCIWRLLDGEWYWSLRKLDALDLVRSMAAGNPAAAAAGANPAPAMPPMPGAASLSPAPAGLGVPPSLSAGVNLPAGLGRPEAMATMGTGIGGAPAFSMDKTEVTLKPSTTATVTITNSSAAPMTLFLVGKFPGVEGTLDRSKIAPGEKAVLSIHAAAGATGGPLVIGVAETNAMITLPVTVK